MPRIEPRTRAVHVLAAHRRGSLVGRLALPLGILVLCAIALWQRGAFDMVRSSLDQPARTTTAAPAHTGALPALIAGRTVRIVDGDGLVLSTGDEIRLGDFNAPEWNQPGGPEAKEALRDIAYGKDLVCTPCEGARNAKRCTSYDRIIATCRLNGTRLGDLMRARGLAEGGR